MMIGHVSSLSLLLLLLVQMAQAVRVNPDEHQARRQTMEHNVNTAEGSGANTVSHRVACQTTKGRFVLDIYRQWAPIGADHFIRLIKDGFFSEIAFFRCVSGFLTQFGISDNPAMKHWHNKEIEDDVNMHRPIKKGYLSFAGGGPNTRSTQMFIAFEELDFLGKEPWEVPFGEVKTGTEVLDKLFKGYGDIPPFGQGPDQQKIHSKGNSYVRDKFPLTDFIKTCAVEYENVAFLQTLPDYMAKEPTFVNGDRAVGKEDTNERGSELGSNNLAAAASRGDLDAVRSILEGSGPRHSVDMEKLTLRDNNGWQAIHEAVRSGEVDVVKYLIEHGADMASTTNNGGNLMWWARTSFEENHEVIRYLESIGAPEGDPDL